MLAVVPWAFALLASAIAGAAVTAAISDDDAPETQTERTKARLIWAVVIVLTVGLGVWLWRRT